MNKSLSYLKTAAIGLTTGFFGAIIGLVFVNIIRWYLSDVFDLLSESYVSILVVGFPYSIEGGGRIVLIGGSLFGIIGAFVGLKSLSSRLWLWGGVSGFLINLFVSVWPQ